MSYSFINVIFCKFYLTIDLLVHAVVAWSCADCSSEAIDDLANSYVHISFTVFPLVHAV